jgi:heat-inducible transcriptional repressor
LSRHILTEWTESDPQLSERQARVLRAVMSAYVGAASPVGSSTVARVLSTPLSSASIRNTMAELAELGLIEKPHTSAGRVPTEAGLRLFIDHLLQPSAMSSEEQRRLRFSFVDADAQGAMHLASNLLSESTRQLGFVLMPNLDRVRLRYVTLVRVAHEKILAIFISQSGRAYQRAIRDSESGGQEELNRIAAVLNERIGGRTLCELRSTLDAEAAMLRHQAGSLLARAVSLGQHALELAGEVDDPMGLLVATRMALLDQPEFNDPERLRELFGALDANDKLLHLMESMLDAEGVHVALGTELEGPGLSSCALVTAPYGIDADDRNGSSALGLVGVIGPSRMDYARVIPLVGYCSELVTEKLFENNHMEELDA